MTRGITTYAVSTDPAGSPRAYVTSNGTIVKRIERGPFGELISQTATTWHPWIGFAGGFEDPETPLVRFWHRDYHTVHGRWTSIDPSLFDGSPTNLWAYAENNPVDFSDPTGLICLGFSVFAGPGASVESCLTAKGFSTCFEAGAGLGGGIAIKPFGEPAKHLDTEFEAAVSASVLGVGAEIGGKLTNCFTPILKIGAGPLTKDLIEPVTGDQSGSGKDLDKLFQDARALNEPKGRNWDNFKKVIGIEGKVSGKFCLSTRN